MPYSLSSRYHGFMFPHSLDSDCLAGQGKLEAPSESDEDTDAPEDHTACRLHLKQIRRQSI